MHRSACEAAQFGCAQKPTVWKALNPDLAFAEIRLRSAGFQRPTLLKFVNAKEVQEDAAIHKCGFNRHVQEDCLAAVLKRPSGYGKWAWYCCLTPPDEQASEDAHLDEVDSIRDVLIRELLDLPFL
jgi:hypothetical protein